MKDGKKMLGGWCKATLVLGVLVLLLGVAGALMLRKADAVVECITGALGLFLLSGVLEWLGEVESHLSAIRSNTATSADRLARVERMMATSADKLVRMERMMDAGAQAGARGSAAPRQDDAQESKPGVYDTKAEADIYRMSQNK